MGDKDLIWALKTGEIDDVKTKLTAEDINRTLEEGRKPLHYTADYGHKDVMEYLISKGADVNALDKHKLSPLLYACGEGHVACVTLLLEKGADKTYRGPNGLTALEISENDAIKALLK